MPKGPKGKDKFMITIFTTENSKQFLTNYLQGKEGALTLKESFTIWFEAKTFGFTDLRTNAQNIILNALQNGNIDEIKNYMNLLITNLDLYLWTRPQSFENVPQNQQELLTQLVHLASLQVLEKAQIWLKKAGFDPQSDEIIIQSDVKRDHQEKFSFVPVNKRTCTKQYFSDIEANYLSLLMETQKLAPRKIEISNIYIYIYKNIYIYI